MEVAVVLRAYERDGGDGWKWDYGQAWAAAFDVVASTILEGAAEAEAELEAAA